MPRGRKPTTVTPEQREGVTAMARCGIPEDKIARVIGCDPKTLRKFYRDELDVAHVEANTAVAQNLYNKAIGDGPQSVTAAIFWCKTRLGWRDSAPVVIENNNTTAVQVEVDGARERITAKLSALSERIDGRVAGLAIESGAGLVSREAESEGD